MIFLPLLIYNIIWFQIFTSAHTHLFSANLLLKSKCLLHPNPMIFLPLFICIITWFQIFTSAHTHLFFLLVCYWNSNVYFFLTPWFFFFFSYITSYDFKSLLQLTSIFFCLFVIKIQIFTLAPPMIFLHFSFINESKSKSLLHQNATIFFPFFICIDIWFQILTLAHTHLLFAYLILKSLLWLSP